MDALFHTIRVAHALLNEIGRGAHCYITLHSLRRIENLYRILAEDWRSPESVVFTEGLARYLDSVRSTEYLNFPTPTCQKLRAERYHSHAA